MNSEKIQTLALAALNSTEALPRVPRPAGFMLSFDSLRSQALFGITEDRVEVTYTAPQPRKVTLEVDAPEEILTVGTDWRTMVDQPRGMTNRKRSRRGSRLRRTA